MNILNKLQLGRLPSIRDSRNLKLKSYLPIELPKIPEDVEWQLEKESWGVMGNDVLGNCVICTAAHILDCAQINESHDFNNIPDRDVINLSYKLRATNGYTILERLKYWRKTGMFGSKIEAYVSINLQNHQLLQTAIFLFGHADIGIWMPVAWEQHPQYWDTGKGEEYRPGSWGGHSVCLVGYKPDEKFTTIYYAISWGQVIEITRDALNQYMDEAWVSILPDWAAFDAVSPSGFDMKTLRQDLELIS